MGQTGQHPPNLFQNFTESLVESFAVGLDDPAFGKLTLRDVNQMSGNIKVRQLYPPNDDMRVLQARVLTWLRSLQLPLACAAGGSKGDSPLGNVRRHRHNRHFVLMDLAGAFENLTTWRIAIALTKVEPLLDEQTIRRFLWDYCTSDGGGLATGAPASTLLFNTTLGWHLDQAMARYCGEHGITYSRYIDDLTFSAPRFVTAAERRDLRQMIEWSGFAVNHRKSQVLDLAKSTVVINGVGLAWGGRTFVPGPYQNKLKGMLLRAWHQRDVNPAEIYGRMGAVKSCLGHADWLRFNRREAKLMSLYAKWRRRQRRMEHSLRKGRHLAA